MKKNWKILCGILVCIALCCALFTACSKKNDDSVTEQPAAEDIVMTAAEFHAKLSAATGKEYKNYTLKLGKDIDLSELNGDWKPIGQSLTKAFCGTLDGQGYTIKGLKITGWKEDGTPKTIAKEIIGWLDSGEPVYKSSEIVKLEKGSDLGNGKYAVADIVREGDDADGKYQDLEDGKGVFETRASFGSVGLFGYTNNATIKNLTVSDADISFYASGDYTYAGIISGYDICSTFDNVTVNNGKINISTIYDREYSYNVTYATPDGRFEDVNGNKQFVGGVVGYAKGSTQYDNGKVKNVGTKFISVTNNGFQFSNANYAAFYDAGIVIVGEKESACLATTGEQNGYNVSQIVTRSSISNKAFYPDQLMVGGIAGYLSGATLNNVAVDRFNQATVSEAHLNEITGQKYVLAKGLYYGGISAGAYNVSATGISVKNTFASGIYWRNWNSLSANRGYSLVYDKATVGGAFADIGKTKISATETSENLVENFYVEIGETTNLENVCLAGFVGYADDQSDIQGVKVNNLYIYSADIGEGQSDNAESDLGSVLAGAVGVLRNSSLKNATVDKVAFEIGSSRDRAYDLTRGIVAKAIGNSSLSDSTAKDVHKCSQSGLDAAEYTAVVPANIYNNYVNEDGFKSVRLYYQANGQYDKVYVTAFAEVVPADAKGNILYEEVVLKSVDFAGLYTEGQAIDTTAKKYYRYDSISGNYIDIDMEGVNLEGSDKFKNYTSNGAYAEKIDAYRLEITAANKNMALTGTTYYEYNAKNAGFVPTTDTNAVEGKTYYVRKEDATISSYYLLLTVYSESGKVIVVDQKNADDEDDDVLAKARYALSKDVVEGTPVAFSVAETYLATFFLEGTGFKADINGFTIRYFDSSVTNRDFAKYVQITGRPVIDVATVLYQ